MMIYDGVRPLIVLARDQYYEFTHPVAFAGGKRAFLEAQSAAKDMLLDSSIEAVTVEIHYYILEFPISFYYNDEPLLILKLDNIPNKGG